MFRGDGCPSSVRASNQCQSKVVGLQVARDCSLAEFGVLDLLRLRSLSETLLRVALSNPELDTTYTVSVLTAKLRQLDLDVDLTTDADWTAIVHALCRCGLLWTDAVDGRKAVVVMQSLTARAIALDSELSHWLVVEWKASRSH